MADANYMQSSFLGGERAKSAQGRIDLPDYRTGMNVCLNGMPIETGAWTRRPGFMFQATTRSGLPAKAVTFYFQNNLPYTMEFTDGHMRFLNGSGLIVDSANTVVAISTANPAVVQLGTASTWATGDQIIFGNLGVFCPTLGNRVLALTSVDTTHYSLTDAITGLSIDGSTLGTNPSSATISRVMDITTPYVGQSWMTLRSVQTEKQAVLLQSGTAPQVLAVATDPTSVAPATFTFGAANFIDGPYLDPVLGGTLATPSALTGNITLTLSFPAYVATKSYSIGDYVTSSSVNYKSLTSANVGNTPVSSPTNWATVSAADAINSGNGFLGTDIGRHVRLFSEPALWVVGTAYVLGNDVAIASGVNGGYAYYTCTTAHTATAANAPGLGSQWGVNASAAIWTWGKITALSNIIDRALAGSASIGDMTSGGGLAAAFDGVISQLNAASANKKFSPSGLGNGASVNLTTYVGKNYTAASDQKIAQAVVYPSSDKGLAFGTYQIDYNDGTPSSSGNLHGLAVTLNLRGKASAPASSSDGTLIGTSGSISSTTSPITILSTNQTTAWKYVWVEVKTTSSIPQSGGNFSTANANLTNSVGELSLFNPPGSGVSQGVTLQIVGPDLFYTTAVRTWRMGLYSDTTGYPACGTYHEGRLWLSGAVGNRLDGGRPSVGRNTLFNFAPTETDGTVTDSNAIAYVFNAPDVNTIYWMVPDQQGIIVGTRGGEWLVQASNLNSPLTPVSMQAHRVTKIGCANIEPRRTEHTIALVQSYKHKVFEYFSDVFSGKFSAPNITEKAKHLANRGIEEIAYQQELTPVLWARCTDGSLIGCSYKRESLMSSQGPTFAGWHQHTLGSGRTVESVCVGPSTDGLLDSLTIVSNDAVTNIRHVEVMTNLFEEGANIATAWFLDDAVNPTALSTTGTTSMTFSGLAHLNGKTVSVFAGGLDLGDYAVAGGIVTVPFLTGNALFTSTFGATLTTANVVIGFTYNSDGQMVRPAIPQESGARIGPATGKKRRTHQAVAMLVDTQGIYFGTTFAKLNKARLTTPGGTAILPVTTLFTDIWRSSLSDDYSYDSMIAWRVTRPFPATVPAMGGLVETTDA